MCLNLRKIKVHLSKQYITWVSQSDVLPFRCECIDGLRHRLWCRVGKKAWKFTEDPNLNCSHKILFVKRFSKHILSIASVTFLKSIEHLSSDGVNLNGPMAQTHNRVSLERIEKMSLWNIIYIVMSCVLSLEEAYVLPLL